MDAKALKVYEILKSSGGKASTVIDYLENGIEEKIRDGRLVTREDLLGLDKSLSTQIERIQSSLIKWMFGFWIGTIGAVVALVKFL